MSCVLVVDDDPSFVDICEATLRHAGHQVLRAASVGEALAALSERAPDAMLLDWKLPDGTRLAGARVDAREAPGCADRGGHRILG